MKLLPNLPYNNFGMEVRAGRLSSHLRQSDLGIPQSIVSQIETGKINPSWREYWILSKKLLPKGFEWVFEPSSFRKEPSHDPEWLWDSY